MEELDSLLQVISSPAYFFDRTLHTLLSVSRPFADLMEHPQTDLIDMSLRDLTRPEEWNKLALALAHSPPEGTAEWCYQTRSGKILYAQLSYRDSLYFDKTNGRRHDIRLVVISDWETRALKTSDEVFG